MSDTLQEVSKETVTAGTVKFGIGQINQPTPLWVKWIFRTEFVLNKVVLFWLGSQDQIGGTDLKQAIIWIACVDMFVWGMGKFVGVTKEEMDR